MKNTSINNLINQETGVYIDFINQLRIDEMNSKLRVISNDYSSSVNDLKLCRDSIKHVIDINRGANTGMHGFIGERLQVFLANSRAHVLGDKPLYYLIDDDGPVDYLRGLTPIQQKACLSDKVLGLRFVSNHANKYPFFVTTGGIYEIPKDSYEKYISLLNTPKDIAGKMRKEDYKLWKNIQRV